MSIRPFAPLGFGALVFLFLEAVPLLAQEQGAFRQRAAAYRARPLAEKLSSPRRTMETFCFALDAYGQIPEMIGDAVVCLDLDQKEVEPGTAELLAIQLEEILAELSLPFEGLLDNPQGKSVTFHEDQGMRIVLARQADGLWRFDRQTVEKIPALRRLMANRSKSRQALGSKLRAGMEDPTATMTSFLDYAVKGDYESAALRLDLSEIPFDQRQRHGKILAWELACVMQRRGYLFSQSVPIDPEGPPYTWSADRSGRITVERVPRPGGKDTWLFGRTTVAAVASMWQALQDKPVDVRYEVLRKIVAHPPQNSDSDQPLGSDGGKPASVPPAFASPRAMLQAFFRVLDASEFDDAKLQEACTFMDLSQFSPEDIPFIGPKRATMLEALLRKIKLDLRGISDHWSAPPQVLAGPAGIRVEIVRQADGCWRFSAETVAQLPAMYESIGGQDKTVRAHGLANPRETLVTFLSSIDQRDDDRAARCLDLSDFPPSTRDNLGPVLAFKLKYVLDRIGRIYLQEIPNDPDGPRFIVYRGSLGRIVLARGEDDNASKNWVFTAATVGRIEDMFERVLNQPVDEQLASSEYVRKEPEFLREPGIWFQLHVPAWLAGAHAGLRDYQWLGLCAVAGLSWCVSRFMRWGAFHLILWGFYHGSAATEKTTIRNKLRSLETLTFLLIIYELLEWVDLPAAVAAHIFMLQKLFLTAVLTWAGFQWIDLGRLFYERSEQLKPHRGLGDLLVPFAINLIKLGVVLTSAIYLVHQFGQGEHLTRFLTGIGIVGLAVSLAAQDSLKNLFGTLLLISDRSFRIGDRLFVGDKEGVVEQVGFRSTKLRTPDDSLLILPNALLANGVVDNLGLCKYRRIRMLFYVALKTPLDRLEALRDGLQQYLTGRPAVDRERIHVHFQRIGETGIELEVWAYIESKDPEVEKHAREDLLREVLRLAKDMEIEIAPTKK